MFVAFDAFFTGVGVVVDVDVDVCYSSSALPSSMAGGQPTRGGPRKASTSRGRW